MICCYLFVTCLCDLFADLFACSLTCLRFVCYLFVDLFVGINSFCLQFPETQALSSRPSSPPKSTCWETPEQPLPTSDSSRVSTGNRTSDPYRGFQSQLTVCANFLFTIPTKSCACANSRRFFVTADLKSSATYHHA